MRPSFNSKRPRGGRLNMRRGSGHHRSHTLDSSGPDVKVRGSASQIFEKYLALARDATVSGDRVTAESYLQHAEHYHRVNSSDGSGQRPNPPFQTAAGDDATPAEGAAPETAPEAQP